MQCVLALLQAEFVTQHSGLGLLGAAEASALIADDRLNRRQQFGRSHERHRHARALEDRFDHLAVAVVGDDRAIFHGVTADDSAGGHGHVEDGIAGGGELVYQFAGRRAAVEHAGIGFLDDHDAGTLDAIVAGVHGGGHEVRKSHVGDEAAALFHAQQRLFAVRPLLHAQLSIQDAGIHANVGNRLGEAERSAQRLTVRSGCWRDRERHVVGSLFGSAALVDGGQRQASGEAAGSGSGVNPRQFKRGQRQRQVLRSGQVAALFGIHEYRGDAGLVEGLEQRGFFARSTHGCRGAPGRPVAPPGRVPPHGRTAPASAGRSGRQNAKESGERCRRATYAKFRIALSKQWWPCDHLRVKSTLILSCEWPSVL